MRDETEAQSHQYNLAAILLFAGLGLLIVSLGVILYHDDDDEEERRYTKESELESPTAQPPVVILQPQIVSQLPATPLMPNARRYAPQGYIPEIDGQNAIQGILQTGPRIPTGVVHRGARLLSAPRSSREQDWSYSWDRRDILPRRDDASTGYQQYQPAESVSAFHTPGYTLSESTAYTAKWPASEIEPSIPPPRRVAPSYEGEPMYFRYQNSDGVQGYGEPYTQPYYTAPYLQERNTGADYPASDYHWPAPNPPLNPLPLYTQPRTYSQTYHDGRW